MKAIIIAAGSGKRLLPLTKDKPKCMLNILGIPLLSQILKTFRNSDVNDVAIIRGYKADKINFNDVTYFTNSNFESNNILHSLMYAKDHFKSAIESGEDLFVTYSDIIFKEEVLKKLVTTDGNISLVIDKSWESIYVDRNNHGVEEAEKVISDEQGRIIKIGKDIESEHNLSFTTCEFIGLWKLSPIGAQDFLNHFEKLNEKLSLTDPFQNTKEWQKSYITDMFQYLINEGIEIQSVTISNGWREFDTVEDFENFGGMANEIW